MCNKSNINLLTARLHKESPDERTAFQHDRDRIIHSRAFRRLMHKTQIFNANKGDHFRNRLTHTLEVMQIGRSIGRLLNLYIDHLLDEDLIEAIAFGHDLGHTPFGHIGERTLNEIMESGIPNEVPAFEQGFKHNYQSVRVVDHIESRCDDYAGINLTLAVREGIIKHTHLTTKNGGKIVYLPSDLKEKELRMDIPHSITLEGQVVAIADEIAQLTHDIEDGVRGNIISYDTFEKCDLVRTYKETKPTTKSDDTPTSYNARNQIIKGMVGFLIDDVKDASATSIKEYNKTRGIPNFNDAKSIYSEKCIRFSKPIEEQSEDLANSRTQWIIKSQEISQADSKAEYFIRQIFRTNPPLRARPCHIDPPTRPRRARRSLSCRRPWSARP